MAEYRAIDADGHFMEPDSIWPRYLPARFHPLAPRRVRDTRGRWRMMIGGRLMPHMPLAPTPAEERMHGGSNAQARLAEMEAEGLDAMIIYPTTGLYFGGVDDRALLLALCRAYNQWASESCAADPRRLFCPALLPQSDIYEAVVELRRAADELGLRGAFLRPNPIAGRTLDNPAFEPLWAALEELDMPAVLHEGTTQNLPQTGLDRYDNFLFRHMISHPFEQQMALLSLICGGVLERHPGLRVMIVEAGCGWVPYWLERMDEHMVHWGHASIELRLSPSEYFRRQCFVSAGAEERMIPQVTSLVGDDNLCFSTDYPHPDHRFRGVVARFRAREDLSAQSKCKILAANIARAFAL